MHYVIKKGCEMEGKYTAVSFVRKVSEKATLGKNIVMSIEKR